MVHTEPELACKGDDVGVAVEPAAQVETARAGQKAAEGGDTKSPSVYSGIGSADGGGGHGVPEFVSDEAENAGLADEVQSKGTWFMYVKTKQFWVVLLLGQVLAICTTSTNTLTTLLNMQGNSIPAFQSFFNYVLLNIIYTSYTLYKLGFKGWCSLVWRDGWRFLILAFMDVEGNYFVVLAYRYTTILSAQLISFWAIAVVVFVSLVFLRVRYHWTQYAGIFLCIGGMGILFGSDQITGANSFAASDQLKGDLFALLSATFYGLSNVFEEFLVSKRPMYEVIGQLAFYAMIINGVQAGIFDRQAFQTAVWNGKVGGYLTGYTLILTLFYSLSPILFRLSSAAFFNISLLTGSFWGVAIGVKVFKYDIHWMYPIAFVCIIIGQVVYFSRSNVLADSMKPWLGKDQEDGVSGIGTAKRRVDKPSAIV